MFISHITFEFRSIGIFEKVRIIVLLFSFKIFFIATYFQIENATTNEEFFAFAKAVELYIEAAGCVEMSVAIKKSVMNDCVRFFAEGRVKEKLGT